jgi:hypothetical protein
MVSIYLMVGSNVKFQVGRQPPTTTSLKRVPRSTPYPLIYTNNSTFFQNQIVFYYFLHPHKTHALITKMTLHIIIHTKQTLIT